MKAPNFYSSSNSEMKKYYLGIGVLSVFIVVVVLITVIGNSLLRQDYKLEQKITEIKTAIDSHVSTKRKLPEILPDVNIDKSGGVDYKKISDSRYMLCASFKTKSDGYVQPEPYLIDDIRAMSSESGVSLNADTSFYDGDKGGLKHEKGYSCIYYEPYNLREDYLKPYTFCDKRYKGIVSGRTVTSVDNTAGTVSMSANYSTRTTINNSLNSTTYTITSSLIYDSQCRAKTSQDIKVGTVLDIYYNDNVSTPESVKIVR